MRTAADSSGLPELRVLGVNFRTAPVEVRESLAFGAAEVVGFLKQMRRALPAVELQLLSTCNRTEFHLAALDPDQAVAELLSRLCRLRPAARILHEDCHRYSHVGDAAVKHLARLACGLDSAILGDAQIHGQLNVSRRAAGEAGTFGNTLEQALNCAGRAAARARRETNIRRGAASIGAAVKEIVQRHAQRLESEPRILIVGAGEVAKDIGRHLSKAGLRDLVFINRTLERGRALAQECGGRVDEWAGLAGMLKRIDVVVTAAACPRPILGCDHFYETPVSLVIDAGMPRNVASDVPVACLNIDQIRQHQNDALTLRRNSVPEVEAIIATELRQWRQWRLKRPLEKWLKELFLAIPELSRELAEAGNVRDIEPIRRRMKRELGRHARVLRHMDLSREESQ